MGFPQTLRLSLFAWLSALSLLLVPAPSSHAQSPLDPFLEPGIDLSGAGALVGRTEGALAADADGSATYDVPLAVPPGTNGVAPELGLAYHSRGADRLLGVGWSLSGLSAIGRCPARLAPDGFIDLVDFDANDRFCLDGQRLVPSAAEGASQVTLEAVFGQDVESDGSVAFEYVSDGSDWAGGSSDDPPPPIGVRTMNRFDVSSIPDGNVILGASLEITVQDVSNVGSEFWRIGAYGASGQDDPEADDALTAFQRSDLSSGAVYAEAVSDFRTVGTQTVPLTGSVLSDLQAALTGADSFALAIQMIGDLSGIQDRAAFFDEFSSANPPRLIVTHQPPSQGLEYRTEIDSFSKIVPVGGSAGDPDSFTVYTKDGRILHYGSTPDSRVEGPNRPEASVWALSRAEDRSGNYWTITYGEENSLQIYAPLRIDYTGNDAANVAPFASVRFRYETRPDGGIRMSQIETYDGSTPVRAYALSYEVGSSTGRSRLVSLQECGFDASQQAACLPPTTLGWQEGADDFDPAETWLPAGSGPGGIPVVNSGHQLLGSERDGGDLNGDGLDDYMWLRGSAWHVALSNGAGFDPPSTWLPANSGPGGISVVAGNGNRFVADFNGDGLDDFMWTRNSAWHVALSNGAGFDPPTTWLAAGSGPGGIPVVNAGNQDTADLNGDGRADYVWARASAWHVALSNGVGFDPPTTWLPANGGPGGLSVVQGSADRFFTDLNADGRADYLWRKASAWQAALSNGSGFDPATTWLPAGSGPGGIAVFADGHQLAADLNGDGRSDYAWLRNSAWHAALSNGESFEAPTTWLGVNQGPGGIPVFSGTRYMHDMNGDGRDDLLWLRDSAWHVALSNGAQFVSPATWLGANEGPGGISVVGSGGSEPADLNGDGLMDLAWVRSSAWHVALSSGPAADLLVEVTDGLGGQSQLAYASLTAPGVHEKGTGAVYPVVDIQDSTRVVTELRVPDGLGGQTVQSLGYRSLRRDVRRQLSLGFSDVDQMNESRGMLTTTAYSQTFPRHGRPQHVEMWWGSVRAMRVFYDFQSESDAQGKIYRVWQAEKTDEFFELDDGSLTVSRSVVRQFDAFNNPVVESTATGDGIGRVITTAYTNDPSSWLIGLATQIQTEASSPGVPNLIRTVAHEYDASTGLRTRTIREPGSALELVQDFARDAHGNVVQIATSGAGIPTRSQSVSLDADGRYPTQRTNALGQGTTLAFDGRFGKPSSVTHPSSLTTSFSYDPLGRESSLVKPDGTAVTQTRLSCASAPVACPPTGVVSLQILEDGAPPQYVVRDVLARDVRRSTLGLNGGVIHQDTEYDLLGRVDRSSLPFFDGAPALWTEFEYDGIDRPVSQTAPDGSVTAIAYDGLTRATTNALGQTTVELRNSQDQLLQVTDALGNTSAYAYDAFGNPLSVVDAQGNVVVSTFDVLGRRLTLDDPDLGLTTTTYDVLGQVTQETDAKGQVRSFSYDLLGRLTQRTEADGQQSYTYDSAPFGIGQLAQASGNFGSETYTRSYTYDSSGRLSSTTLNVDAQTYGTSQTYDASGRISEFTYPSGFATRRVYSASGHLVQVEDASTGSPYWTAELEDASGQLTRELFGNGLRTQRSYDPLTLRLEQIESGPGGGSSVQDLAYSWDVLGNLLSRSDGNQSASESFSYDALNRLTQAQVAGETAVTVTYDAVGNLVSKSDVGTYSSGGSAGPHAVTSIVGPQAGSFTYDANGNQTERFDGFGVSQGTLTYTSFDKPALITAANGTGTNFSAFLYDEQRALLGRHDVVDDGASATETQTYYVSGIYEEVLHADGSSEQRHFVPGRDQVVAVWTTKSAAADELRYLHRDHLGSIDVITDAAGATVENLSFDAFGKRRNPDWTASIGPVASSLTKGFTGHEQLDHLGLVHMGGRVYDPTLARFTSPDPFVQFPESTQGFNRYSYVLSNPLAFTDPSGFFLSSVFGFFGGIGGAIGSAFTTVGSTLYSAGGYLFDSAVSVGAQVGQYIADGVRFVGDSIASAGRALGDALGLPNTQEQWERTKTVTIEVEPPRSLRIDPEADAPPPPGGPVGAGPSSQGGLGVGDALLIAGSIVASVFPGLGELLDLAVLVDPDSTGLDRGLAAVSLGANLVFPFLPNFGAAARATRSAGQIDDAVSAAATVGRRGQRVDFPNPNAPTPRNAPGTVGGREFSGHAFDRIQERGFTPSVVENAIQTGKVSPGVNPGTLQYFDPVNKFNVITDQATGRVITVF